ncbi:MAG: aminopeptidase N [Actinomycetaceae bacterium]|nr:aminopeptidase N [Actinomycetaceae bacterium]
MQTLTKKDAQARDASVTLNEIDVFLDLSNAKTDADTFQSKSVMRLRTDRSEVFVDLIADAVEKVEVNGEPARFEASETRVTIFDLPTNADIELSVEAACKYSTTGEGLHRYTDPEDGETYLYTQYEPTDARRVYACFDQPGMKARWQFQITAPADWTVLSNQSHSSRILINRDEGVARWTFERTMPLSSYITAVVAGPYAHVDGGVWSGGASDGKQVDVPLGIYCRRALQPYLDAEDILKVTRAGLDFYHSHYGFTYPWGKYDQIFVPEYNLGAMENPGCVTFNEKMISRDTPTKAARQSRANVIFHEMCHMWFGDLVTPKWWDDLWLKESFADNQGSFGLAENTEFTDEWATFASGRKEWAYKQDQLPTSHPIAAEIEDVEAAKNNFDGITYAKGAAVLKQLVAYVGADSFFAGARRYFQDHAFGATKMADFLRALEESSDRDDLDAWQKAWLHTVGPSKLHAKRHGDHADIIQESIDPTTGETQLRPHRINIGFYKTQDDKLVRVAKQEITLSGQRRKVDYPKGEDDFDLILPNEDDLTYAIVVLDEDELKVALKLVGTIAEATSRAVVWSALWAAVRDARVNPRDYVKAVTTHVVGEGDDAVASDLIANALHAITYFMPTNVRRTAAATFANLAIDAIGKSTSKDRKRQWAQAAVRGLILAGSPNDDQVAYLQDLAAEHSHLLEVGPSLAWQARVALSAIGKLEDSKIEEYLQVDRSGEAEVFALRARAARPDRLSRHRYWDSVLETEMANDKMTAILNGLSDGALANDVLGFAGDFFDLVLPFWNDHTIGMGTRFVRGAYPGVIDATRGPDAEALRFMASHWLSQYDEAPDALRRLMLEEQDELERRLRIQTKWLTV